MLNTSLKKNPMKDIQDMSYLLVISSSDAHCSRYVSSNYLLSTILVFIFHFPVKRTTAFSKKISTNNFLFSSSHDTSPSFDS